MQTACLTHPTEVETAYKTFRETRKFDSLDGVRALRILAVIWHHAPAETPGMFFQRGFLGVDMFFVLSGFLIVTLLLRERARAGTISLRKFYARRTLRIFPIYYLVLFGLVLYYLLTRGSTGARATSTSRRCHSILPTRPTGCMTAGLFWGVMWSLATEEQFYLCWPLVEKSLRPRGIAVVIVAVLVLNQLINFGFLRGFFAWIYGGSPGLPILQATFTPIALGVLLAHLLHDERTFGLAYRFLGKPYSCAICGAILIALLALSPADIQGAGRLSIQLSMMLFLGSIVIAENHWARPLLTLTPLAYLGVISYGMYIYHMLALHVMRGGFARAGWRINTILFYLAVVIATTVVAGLSFRWLESPLLKLKDRFASDRGLH